MINGARIRRAGWPVKSDSGKEGDVEEDTKEDLPHVIHVISAEEEAALIDGTNGELGKALLELMAEGKVTIRVRGKPGEQPRPFRGGEP